MTAILLVCIMVFPIQTTFAEEQLGDFKDDSESHYHLDTVPDEYDDGDYFGNDGDNKRGFLWMLDITDVAYEKLAELFNYLANLGLKLNMYLTRLMISALDIAYDFNFVNNIIDEISSVMKEITGISPGGKFRSGGIFGQLAIFVAVFTVIYAVFMLVFKRSMFKSLGAMLQTILCLALAILLFTNYSPFLKGINNVTTEMSSIVLSGNSSKGVESQDVDVPAGIESGEDTPTGLNEESARAKMRDNLWSMFVDRPYLYMMYGKTSTDENLSEERVKRLLKKESGSKERLEVVEEEVKGTYETSEGANGVPNEHLLHSNVSERIAFTPIYLSINGITSFLVYALAILLVLFQFWFMLIAVFAPFALLIGSVPGMFNVIKRYSIELALPLILKIVVSFGALIVFVISEVLYSVDMYVGEGIENPLLFYMAVVLIHWVLFGLLFFLRKRLSNIFVSSTGFLKEVKEGMNTATQPMKKAVQTATTATAMAGGAMTGGAHGALVGADIGKKAGEAMTGDASVGDVASTAAKAKMYSSLGKNSKAFSGNNDVEKTQTNNENKSLSDEAKTNIQSFMDKQGFTEEEAEHIASELEKEGITDVSEEDLENTHENIISDIEKGTGLKSDYSDMMARGMINQNRKRDLQEQEEKLRKQRAIEQVPESEDWMNESIDMYSDVDAQYDNNHTPINYGEEIPTADTWMSDEVDMYSDEFNMQNEFPNEPNNNSETTFSSKNTKEFSSNESNNIPTVDSWMSDESDMYKKPSVEIENEEYASFSHNPYEYKDDSMHQYANFSSQQDDERNLESLEENMPKEK